MSIGTHDASILHMLWVFGAAFGARLRRRQRHHSADARRRGQNYHWVTSTQFTAVLHDRQTRAGTDDDLCRARSATRRCRSPYPRRAVATVGMFVPSSMIMVASTSFGTSSQRIAVARHRLPRPRAGDRRSGLVERLDDLRGTPAQCRSVRRNHGPRLVLMLRTKLSAPLLIGYSRACVGVLRNEVGG